MNIVHKIWNVDGDILILIYVILYKRQLDKDCVVSNIKVTCVFVILRFQTESYISPPG